MRDTAIKSVMCRFSVCEHWTGKKNVYRCVTYTDELQNSETLNYLAWKQR